MTSIRSRRPSKARSRNTTTASRASAFPTRNVDVRGRPTTGSLEFAFETGRSERAAQIRPCQAQHIDDVLCDFHFCLDETALRLVGTGSDLRQRRRLFIRTLSHAGLTSAFGKLKGATINRSVEDLFRLPGDAPGPIMVPAFVRPMATAYLQARAMREDADYDLSAPLSAADAQKILRRAHLALQAWTDANTQSDRDAKHAVALLLSLKGKLRE